MTPHEFIKKWQNSQLKERAAAQEHFLDLCRLLGEKTPAQLDPTGLDYGFEVGATKTGGGHGFADVFKRGHFGWEYKGTRANLDAALLQLQRYAVALDNPPLLIVSDVGTTIRIHTNWTNSVSKVYDIPIAELGDAEKRGWLKAAFADPETLRPTKTRQQLTEEVAGNFAELARSLRARYGEPEEVAHFINRLVFCMFAEDVKLLKDRLFTRMLERALEDPSEFEGFARDLFRAMSTGGHIGFERVAWFNGGLFDNDRVFALTPEEIRLVHGAALRYWGDIDPSILGTLFERGLDPDKRSQLGAHYTDRDKIMMIIEPVIVEPLTAEWEEAKAEIVALMEKATALDAAAKTQRGKAGAAVKGQATAALNAAQAVLDRYLKRLGDFRVLDPACGSGNFLYLALRALKDLEHRAQVEAEALGLPRGFPRIGPEVVKGIEINPYAAELARVSVWIGEIQWMLKNGFPAQQNPVLKPLETIECRDALLTRSGTEAIWPEADAIIGNPPFLGAVKFLRELGESTTNQLRNVFEPFVPAGANLVCYWFYKASKCPRAGRIGFVSTSAIRSSDSNTVLRNFSAKYHIYSAWADEPWIQDGAALRVSVICGQRELPSHYSLNGRPANQISTKLTEYAQFPSEIHDNIKLIFRGPPKVGPFDITGETARKWLSLPININGLHNSEVLRPLWNAYDVTRRPRDQWVIDFRSMDANSACLFEVPFDFAEKNIRPFRANNRREWRKENWWLHAETVPALRRSMENHDRVIVTPMVSKHRIFRWMPTRVLPDQRLMVICLSSDAYFGVLSSRFHELWAIEYCSWHGAGNDPVYNAGAVFGTFPFPIELNPDLTDKVLDNDPRAIAIAKAAARLNELRENWLNPADLVRREPEVVPGYPDRILPVSPEAEKELKKRTLTNLYNARPTWLVNAHKAVDEAVAAAYGWPADLSDDEILARLFALNQERAAAQGGAVPAAPVDLETEEAEVGAKDQDEAGAKPVRKPRKPRSSSAA